MSIVSIVTILLIITGLFVSKKWLMALCFVLMSFGTFAIIEPGYTFGVSILASSIATIALIGKFAFEEVNNKRISLEFLDLNRLGILALFTALAVVSAFAFPLLFSGSVDVLPLRPRTTGAILVTETVRFSASNIAQALYLVLSFLIAVVFFRMAKSPRFIPYFRFAILAGAGAVIVTGLLDIWANTTGTAELLAPFRKASYIVSIKGKIGTLLRIVGLMSEASAYAQVSVTFLCLLLFGRNMFSEKQRQFVVLPMIAGVGTLAAMAVSSTAYIGLIVILIVYFTDSFMKLGVGDDFTKNLIAREMIAAAGVVVVAVLLLMALPDTRTMMLHVFDVMVLSKPTSGSYIERSSWNDMALGSLSDSYFVGVGVGSVRTSNFFANLVSSTGVLGALLFFAFLFVVFRSKGKTEIRENNELIRMAKLSLIPIFVMLAMVGTVPDYGFMVGALFGIVTGASLMRDPGSRRRRSKRRQKPALLVRDEARAIVDGIRPSLTFNPVWQRAFNHKAL